MYCHNGHCCPKDHDQVLAFRPQVLFLLEGFPSKSTGMSCNLRSLLQTTFSLCGRDLYSDGKRHWSDEYRAWSDEYRISSIAESPPENHVLELDGNM